MLAGAGPSEIKGQTPGYPRPECLKSMANTDSDSPSPGSGMLGAEMPRALGW